MNALADIIRREAGPGGVLSFARFMELALYCPVHGYYETEKDTPGRHGDFYTSVGAGELFGQLLAFQFSEWLAEIGAASTKIVEAGAHDGRLARDILTWLHQHRPALLDRLEYWIIESSARRQAWQKETLKDFRPRIRSFSRFNDSTIQRFNGIIFSNELLDAFPVHRFGWDASKKNWFEWGVAVNGDKFTWTRIAESRHLSLVTRLVPPLLLEVLPDGYIIEVCPAAEKWWREATGLLQTGRLMTIDYGLTADELFVPGRQRGTLRGYFRHHVADDVLDNAGEQDITAHVNFSAIRAVGESVGLVTETFSTQAQFLTRILDEILKHPGTFGEWGSKQGRQFQTLTHPEHLGRAFRVLVQAR